MRDRKMKGSFFDLDGVLVFTAGIDAALELAGCRAMVWDQPHSEADYPGEVTAWIDRICSE